MFMVMVSRGGGGGESWFPSNYGGLSIRVGPNLITLAPPSYAILRYIVADKQSSLLATPLHPIYKVFYLSRP
jgi:hypothetical protein